MTPKSFTPRRVHLRTLASVMILLVLVFGPGSAFSALAAAQEVTGNIQGEVKDQNGAVVPNATVTASAGQRTLTATTDSKGEYRFSNLQPGVYTVSVTAGGFSELKRENITVELGKTLQVNLDLQAGGTKEVVTVTASQEPIVDVTSSKTATNITRQQIDVLPKRSLNFTTVLEVAPGTRSEGKSGGFQIDGASGSENVFVIDGVEVTNIIGGTLGGRNSQTAKNIPLDFVKEVQVKSAGYEAEYGGATGGVVNVVTRGGTNDVHGELRMEYTSDKFRAIDNPDLLINRVDATANSIEYRQNPTGKDKTRFFNPVFSLGGPILKDKLWFFTSYAPQYFKNQRLVNLIQVDTTTQRINTLNTRLVDFREKDDYFLGRLDFSPTSKLQVYGNFINSPVKTEGAVPPLQTTSDFTFGNPRYPFQGGYTPASQVSFGANYNVRNNLIVSFRGGRTFLNDKGGSYDIPFNTPLVIISVACLPPLSGCASGTTTTGNPTILTNSLTQKDITKRTNLNFDATYITRVFGQQHVFKGGYQTNRLSNDVLFGFSGGRLSFNFNRAFAGQRGAFGYYIVDEFARSGNVNSNNQGFFIQDSWQIHPRVTVNIGLRDEKEFLPSFPITAAGHPDIPPDLISATSKTSPISFGYGDKLAPRLGGAWDVFGNGKLKIVASYSVFFDTMKYELPRGSFGGEVFLRTFRRLEQPDFRGITLTNTPGTVIAGPVDLRFPANVLLPGELPNVDPKLKPFREHEYSASAEYAIRNDLVAGFRFIRKTLDRTIEDVGALDANGNEVFTIGNPGFGTTIDRFVAAGYDPTPKAVRRYTGYEFRLDKRFSNHWYAQASYLHSELFGNYSGLASSDENGRTSPNVNRYFDLPEIDFDAFGRHVLGALATDRPNTFKLFTSYRFNWKVLGKGMETEIGGSQLVYQGIPISTQVQTRIGPGIGVPIYSNGRGDLGRTPVFTQTDLILTHYVNINERVKLRFQASVFNAWDERNVTNRFPLLTGPGQTVVYCTTDPALTNCGNVTVPQAYRTFLASNGDFTRRITAQNVKLDPRYNKASTFQTPREARFAIGITF